MSKGGYDPWDALGCVLAGKAAAATDPWLARAGKPYRPGSGTEGMAFDEVWCDRCARDDEYRSDPDSVDPMLGCRILADTLCYDINDPRYPKEWIYGGDGRPRCTAFTTDQKKPLRCDKTPDMFDEPISEQ